MIGNRAGAEHLGHNDEREQAKVETQEQGMPLREAGRGHDPERPAQDEHNGSHQ